MIRKILSIFKYSSDSFEGQEEGEQVLLLLRRHIFVVLPMYPLNTVTITDRRIIDKDQHGFFNQKVSELHVNRIQDVTVHTKGILETLLHFGKIIVQTAASEKQFVFHQMPDPEQVKDVIMKAIASKKPEMKNI